MDQSRVPVPLVATAPKPVLPPQPAQAAQPVVPSLPAWAPVYDVPPPSRQQRIIMGNYRRRNLYPDVSAAVICYEAEKERRRQQDD